MRHHLGIFAKFYTKPEVVQTGKVIQKAFCYALERAKDTLKFILNCMLLGGSVTLLIFSTLAGAILTEKVLMLSYDYLDI